MYWQPRSPHRGLFTPQSRDHVSMHVRLRHSRVQAVRSLPKTFQFQPCMQAVPKTPVRHLQQDKVSRPAPPSPLDSSFWRCSHTWRRARVNTLRCLAGCTLGDFSTMWYLQSQFPALGVGSIMGISSRSLSLPWPAFPSMPRT